MRLIIKPDYGTVSEWIAKYIVQKINLHNGDKPFVLGLPTGSSPLGVYRELIRLYENKKVSFQNVVTFNMDEYIGLEKGHAQSYRTFMEENFFNHVDILPENCHIPDGNSCDINRECIQYEEKILQYGGIDLFLGGVGEDGHIAFNEPGSSLQSKTRIKTLTNDTILNNARFFNNNPSDVPKTAITVGVSTIMSAREVIIIACGHNKARSLKKGVEGSVNQMWTISALQLHPKGIIVCDEDATTELKVGTYRYFKEIEGNII
ncbi:glucosamine-6-phosphate deaminase [Natronoflexus pectinivorans]|uniref:Glucosamine-6-phosphate deaminase n=1 Tax=Natronoflexus pectinivorans TaxID=682526 RepID=A0A4R2GGM0_9BACT|nr:glucosamine-6-phosphate deaminase [Natronoflexus pectinivorans]TCO07459.1 glucosamine-6-phosphate deaminase [Natronoflexus pectinivorans]